MKRPLVLVSIIVGGLPLVGCGSGAKQTAHYTTTPPTTNAGVGVATTGPPPTPSTLTACASRWNSAANTSGRTAAKQRAAKASSAHVQTAIDSGYFREYAGRCLIYLIMPPKSAVVFVEMAPGRFTFIADATGQFSTNADLEEEERLRLR